MVEPTSVDTSEVGVPPSKRPRMSECGDNSMYYDQTHQYHMIRGSPSSDSQLLSHPPLPFQKRKHKTSQLKSPMNEEAPKLAPSPAIPHVPAVPTPKKLGATVSLNTTSISASPTSLPNPAIPCVNVDYGRHTYQHHVMGGDDVPISQPHLYLPPQSNLPSNSTPPIILSPDKGNSIFSVPDDPEYVYTCSHCHTDVELRWHCNECDDYDLCQTCYATVGHDHPMEKLGFNMGDDEKTSQNTIANQAELFEFLIHACQCLDHTCSKPLCIKMKQLLRHARDCKMRASGKCSACNFFIRMCTSHAQECKEAKCPVPICATLKQKMVAVGSPNSHTPVNTTTVPPSPASLPNPATPFVPVTPQAPTTKPVESGAPNVVVQPMPIQQVQQNVSETTHTLINALTSLQPQDKFKAKEYLSRHPDYLPRVINTLKHQQREQEAHQIQQELMGVPRGPIYQNPMQPQPYPFPPPQTWVVSRNWHSEVNSDLRNHLIKKLVEAIYPVPESQVPVDNRVASLYQYAVRVERSMFETANSREDYYEKLANKIYRIRKELDEKRKNRRNEQNRMALLDQHHLHQAFQKSGSIETRITKAVIQGPARAGKTSVKCLILSKPYTSNISTGCIESPQIAVGEFSMSRHGRQNEYHWELVDHETMVKKFASEIRDLLQDVLQHSDDCQSTAVTSLIVSISLSVLSKSSFSQFTSSNVSVHQSSFKSTAITNLIVSVPLSMLSKSSFSQFTSSNVSVQQSSIKDDIPRNNVTMELCDIITTAYGNVNKLTYHKEWLYFIDCGGQIQFQQLVQAFVPCASVLMLVTNLAEDLSSQSSTDLQCEDGRYCVSDYSPSVETLLRRLTLMVTSSGHQQQSITSGLSDIIKIPEKVTLITVATHRDDYDHKKQQNREKMETIEEKEEKLAQIFHSVESNLFYHDIANEKILHEVDGRNAFHKIFDDPVIKEIRTELRKQAFEVDIPLSWYAFEILLCEKANKGCGVLSLDECIAIGTGLGFTEEEVQSALKFFHLLNTILYYEGVSDLVFVFPNKLIEVVSELVVLVCKIRNNVPIGPGFRHCNIVAKKGIISKNVFTASEKSLHISRSFPDFSSQLLEIFEHLLIATKMSEDQFFMPALLPLTDPSQFSPFNLSSLLYYFENGTPLGLFCAMIVNLLLTTVNVDDLDMSQLFDNPYFFFDNSVWSIDTTSPMYANVIALDHFDISEKVVFVESNDCYEVYFKCPEDKARLEKQIDSILSDTIIKRQFKSEIQPKKATFCPCSQQPCHAAILRSRSLEVRCTKSNKVVTLPKDSERLSLEPQHIVPVTPDITDNTNSDLAVEALRQCTDVIVRSNIDPIILASKLYSMKIISEDLYKRVKDNASRDTNGERLGTILDDIRDRVKYDTSIMMTFVDILRNDFERNDLADMIMSKFK